MAYSSCAEGFCSTANGYCFHTEGAQTAANSNTVDSWEQLINAFYKLNMNVKDAANAIENLQQILYSQLGTASSVMTENPKQKSDLEISNRIEISDEFLNLKIDN